MCGLVPNPCIHVSLSHLYTPRIGFPIWLQQNRQTVLGIYKCSQVHECGDTEHYNSILEIPRPGQFHFWEYINRNQTFIMVSHRSFILGVCWRFCCLQSHHWSNCFKHKLIITRAVNNCHQSIEYWLPYSNVQTKYPRLSQAFSGTHIQSSSLFCKNAINS
jgi:hypothetical protein